MPRTCIRIPFSVNQDTVDKTIRKMLTEEGFKETTINGESRWKKGIGIFTSIQFVKIDYSENEVLLFGWLYSGFGSISPSEAGLTGISGFVPKRQLLKKLNKIKEAVSSLK